MSESGTCNVFLSYSSRDDSQVQRLSVELVARGVRCAVNPWYSRPGDDWTLTLRDALESVQAVALFLGPGELSSWQQRERAWALARLASGAADFVVIPVLLPGATPPAGLLQQLPWVDLRPTDPGTVRLSQAEEQRRLDVLARLLRREQLESSEPPVLVPSPYRGRQHFREEDAEMFFGRDTYAAHLHRLIRQHRMVAVTGPTGCGKSSLVRAGLLPQLRMSGTDGEVWEIVTVVPGAEPLRSLAAAFRPLLTTNLEHREDGEAETRQLSARLENGELRLGELVRLVLQEQPGTTRLLLVVDQWEDLYKHGKSSADCERLVQEILEEVREPGSRLRVIFTIRWDFYGEVLKHRPLLDALVDARVELGPLNATELHAVIQLSAEKGGLRFEPGLVERIVADADANPANLAVLGFILDRLWQTTAPERLVTSSAYSAVGNMVLAAAARVAGEANEAGAKDCMKRGLRAFVDRYFVRSRVQWLIGTVLVCLWVGIRGCTQVMTLLAALLRAPGEDVPAKLDDLEFYSRWTRGYLVDEINRGSNPNERRNAALAMARFFPDETSLDLLHRRLGDFDFEGPDGKNFETAVWQIRRSLGSKQFLRRALALAREGDLTLVTELLASAEQQRSPLSFARTQPARVPHAGHDANQMSEREYDQLVAMIPTDVRAVDRELFLYVWCLLLPGAETTSLLEDAEQVPSLYRSAADAGVHAAARWVLMNRGLTDHELEAMVRDCSEADADAGKRDWYVTRPVTSREGAAAGVTAAPGFTMVHFANTRSANSALWLANREVNVAQFRAVCPERVSPRTQWSGSEDADPMRSVNWYEALIFCNRLSTAQGLPPYYDFDERDYDWDAGVLKPEATYPSIPDQSGTGYRLPGAAEWLITCRASSRVNFSFGRNLNHSPLFVTYDEQMLARPPMPCGARRPNKWGFFDLTGNVAEWCWDEFNTKQSNARSGQRMLCGGSFRLTDPKTMVYIDGMAPESRDSCNGFRIARTRPDETTADTEQFMPLSEPKR